MFVTGHSWGRHANRNICIISFGIKTSSPFNCLRVIRKTRRTVLDTNDADAVWLLGGAYQLGGEADLLYKPDQSLHRHRTKSVGPGTRMILKPGIAPVVSVRAQEKALRAYIRAWCRARGPKIRLS